MEEEKLRISERYEQKLRRKAPLRVVSTQQMVNYLEDDEDDDVLATKARAKQRRSLDSLEVRLRVSSTHKIKIKDCDY